MTYEISNKSTHDADSHYGGGSYARDDHAGWRAARETVAARPQAREIEAKAILNNDREVVILHNDQRYVLRLTRLNKLILTK